MITNRNDLQYYRVFVHQTSRNILDRRVYILGGLRDVRHFLNRTSERETKIITIIAFVVCATKYVGAGID
jgi:hypothetical protein